PTRRGRVLGMDSLARRLDALPCALLPPARPYLDWFEGIGCRTLGQLRHLPRPGLQRRCGAALLDMLDDAHGHSTELFVWLEAPPTFRASLELFDRVEHADALLFGARRLLQQMTGWLCARQFAVERIQLLLAHERGRVARPPTVIDLALGEAVWRDEHLVRLLKERLAQLVLDAPVIGLSLEALQVQPMAPPSDSLFPEPGGTPQERQRLMELLVARLGSENVLQAAPRADYRPEAANQWLPLPTRPAGKSAAPDLPPGLPGMPRPGWLLAQPVALLMREHRPFYGSPLKMVSVAERIEAGWWGQSQARDYFIAEGLDHAHYWVYRERIAGSGEDAAPRWFLHGLFG
ncbi:DNA polymerase, partial [Janthinobacterium sp. AD80]|uniref:DNA polymerase n=1 Tax=Janthinobacterium sp. AD80 TaxID=1528773 RepID=UPI000C838AF9